MTTEPSRAPCAICWPSHPADPAGRSLSAPVWPAGAPGGDPHLLTPAPGVPSDRARRACRTLMPLPTAPARAEEIRPMTAEDAARPPAVLRRRQGRHTSARSLLLT